MRRRARRPASMSCCGAEVSWIGDGLGLPAALIGSGVFARVLVASEPRGRRCPLGAHTGTVGAARRLRCGARPGVASQNSLRSLRSLRSHIRDESVHEACCARRHQGSAPRRPTDRPQRAPPAALYRWVFWTRKTRAAQQRRGRTGRTAPTASDEAEWPVRARLCPSHLGTQSGLARTSTSFRGQGNGVASTIARTCSRRPRPAPATGTRR